MSISSSNTLGNSFSTKSNWFQYISITSFSKISLGEFHKYPLRDEIKRSYKMLYETEASDQDLNEILKMKINASSKGYATSFR